MGGQRSRQGDQPISQGPNKKQGKLTGIGTGCRELIKPDSPRKSGSKIVTILGSKGVEEEFLVSIQERVEAIHGGGTGLENQ